MRYHHSDRAKRAAEVWKNACCLYNILQIDLERYPKGNVILKHSRQRRVLRDGSEKVYLYRYENVDVYGGGQFHLPVKRKYAEGDEKDRWNLRSKVLYRIEVENRRDALRREVLTGIKALRVFKDSREPEDTLEEILELAGRAMGRKERYETYRKQANRKLFGTEESVEDGRLVTDLGEFVRSKNECLFADKLREMGIPYVYELILREEVAPDFTVFIGQKVYYIELLGMMEREQYRERLEEKLAKYKRMRILPGEQLLLIDMTEGADMRRLEKIVRDLFVGVIPDGIVPGKSTE